jgi:hypothetical protein
MGELVQFPKKEKINTLEHSKDEFEIKFGEKLNEDRITFLLNTVTSLLKTTSGDIRNTELYRKYHETASTYTDEEIVWRINNSTEQKVNGKLAFYIAIIEIAKARGIIKKPQDR